MLTALVTGLCFYLGYKGNDLSEAHFRARGYEPYHNETMEDASPPGSGTTEFAIKSAIQNRASFHFSRNDDLAMLF